MDDAITYAREISYVSATITEFERLLNEEESPAEREKIAQTLRNLHETREELRDGLEQLLSIKVNKAQFG
jgi:hypothetical protein